MHRRNLVQAVPLSIAGSLLCPVTPYAQNASASLTPDWYASFGGWLEAARDAATIALGRPFVVTALKFAPGCLLPVRCHPGGGGISLCTSGSLVIRHYDLVEGSPEFSATGAVAEVEETSIPLHYGSEHESREASWHQATD